VGRKKFIRMSAEVKTLPVQHKIGFAADPSIVKQIEAMLELAKSGKLQAVGWACVYHDDLIRDGETNSGWAFAGPTAYALGHAISQLWWRWNAHRQGFDPPT
jgi:hypothetical protein